MKCRCDMQSVGGQSLTAASGRQSLFICASSVCHVLPQSPATLKLVIDDWDAELHSEASSSVDHVTGGLADWPMKAVGSSSIVAWVSRVFVAASGAWDGGPLQKPHLFGGGENFHRRGHMKLRGSISLPIALPQQSDPDEQKMKLA